MDMTVWAETGIATTAAIVAEIATATIDIIPGGGIEMIEITPGDGTEMTETIQDAGIVIETIAGHATEIAAGARIFEPETEIVTTARAIATVQARPMRVIEIRLLAALLGKISIAKSHAEMPI